jgi:hypothetical protein
MTLFQTIVVALLLMFASEAVAQHKVEPVKPDVGSRLNSGPGRIEVPNIGPSEIETPTLVLPPPPPPLTPEIGGCDKHWECDNDCRRAEGTNYCPNHCKKLAC